MKINAKKNHHNKIAIILLVVFLCNFFLPKCILADQDQNALEKVEVANDNLASFFCAIGDIIIETLQDQIVGMKGLKYNGKYGFRYTPATIVSGTLTAFDINFITPMSNEERYKQIEEEKILESKVTALLVKKENDQEIEIGFKTLDNFIDLTNLLNGNWETEYTPGEDLIRKSDAISYIKKLQDKYGFFDEASKEKEEYDYIKFQREEQIYSWWNKEIRDNQIERYTIYVTYQNNVLEDIGQEVRIYKVVITKGVYEKQAVVESIALKLRNIIAKWYRVSREIALVGLLSMLAYVGVRGILFSSTTDKAKYKKMLFDWLTAIVIVMTLHFIISITLTTTKAVSDIFGKKILDENGIDLVMSSLRDNVSASGFMNNMANTVMYYYLVIMTIKYTIQYFKRVVHMAFLTMIGPLIGLTYPLDKIKDGQAQAFTTWIREFIFTALLQPLHLILYFVFIGSAAMSTFAEQNPFYALVVMSFLPEAEKLIRKMFGFEKAGKLGNVEAAFGGAMIMNLMNRMKAANMAGKTRTMANNSAGVGPTQNTSIRTSSNGANPYAALMTSGSSQPQSAGVGSNSSSGGSGGASNSNSGSGGSGGASNSNSGSGGSGTAGGTGGQNSGSGGSGAAGGIGGQNSGSGGSVGARGAGRQNSGSGGSGGARGAGRQNSGSGGSGGAGGTGSQNSGTGATGNTNSTVQNSGQNNTSQQGNRNNVQANGNKKGKIRRLANSAKNKYKQFNEIPTIKGIKAVGGKTLKVAAPGVFRGGIKIAGAVTFGTIGLAAGLTSGEVESAVAGLTGGILAGNKLGGNAANSAINTVHRFTGREDHKLRRLFDEGRYGEKEAEKREQIRKAKQTKEYKNLLEKFQGKEKEIEKFIGAGITDMKKIRIALQNSNLYSTDNAIAYMHMAKMCPAEIFENKENFKVYLEAHGIPKDKADEIYNAVRQYR